jgi:hypothetical protein
VKVTAPARLPLNTWSFVAATFNSTLRIYVNLQLEKASATAGTMNTSTNPLQIGGDSMHTEFFNGNIDNVRVYNTGVAPTQVSADYKTAVAGGTTAPPTAPVDNTPPSISGTANVGSMLTAGTGTWSNGPTGYAYQWQDCNSSGAGCANISGATSSSYAVASGDAGHTIMVNVTATNAGGSASATSSPTGVVPTPQGSAPANTAPPQVSGTATQGQTLGASNGSWSGSPTNFTYQWQDCNSSGGSCANISGATSSTYTLQSSDVAATVRAVVTASNASGKAVAASPVTAAVASGGVGSGGPGGGSGFVAGTCSPSCTATSSYTTYTMTGVPWASTGAYGPGTAATANRQLGIARPAGLVNGATDQTPLVITTGHAAITNDPQWMAAAAKYHFMLVQIIAVCPGAANTGYCKPTTDRPGNVATNAACGSGGALCDDIPMVLSVLNDLENCSGSSSSGTWSGSPPPCENINPNEVFIEGGSAGSTLAEDVACDTRTSSRIAGMQALSGSLFAATLDDTENAPNCPALLGVNHSTCIVDCVTAPINQHISLQWIWGTNDTTYNSATSGPFAATGCPYAPSPATNCLGNGVRYANMRDASGGGSGEWYDPVPSLATTYLGNALGCSAGGTTVSGTGWSGKIATTTYPSCAVAGAATQTIQITGAGHEPDTWPCGSTPFSSLSSGDVCPTSGSTSYGSTNSDGMSDPVAAWTFWTTHFA